MIVCHSSAESQLTILPITWNLVNRSWFGVGRPRGTRDATEFFHFQVRLP